MQKTLLISRCEEEKVLLTNILSASLYNRIATFKREEEAKELLKERDFDLVIIRIPKPDPSVCELTDYIIARGIGQVILIVDKDYLETTEKEAGDKGVFTSPWPIDETHFRNLLKFTKVSYNRLSRLYDENHMLVQKIEDIRIIDRAKCILTAYFQMSEKEAHRSIEKQAMDMRITKRKVAEGILKTYEE